MSIVLITGSCGLVGSESVKFFCEKGFDVIAFDRYNPSKHWGWLENSDFRKCIVKI